MVFTQFKKAFILLFFASILAYAQSSAFAITNTPAKDISVNTTNLNNNLTASENTVQKVVDKIDDLTIGQGDMQKAVYDTNDNGVADSAENVACSDCVDLGSETSGNYAAGDSEAGAALSGDSATGFFPAGQIELARGGLGVDLTLFSGILKIAGGSASYISDLAGLNTALGSSIADGPHTVDTVLSQEEVEDYAGAMVSGNTETLIDVTYDDINGKYAFAVNPNLSNYTNDAGFVTTSDDSVSGAELDGVFSTAGLLKRVGVATYVTITDNSSNWDAAYGWGDHSLVGYLTSETDPKIGSVTNSYLCQGNASSGLDCNIDSSAWDKNSADDFDGSYSSLTSVPAMIDDIGGLIDPGADRIFYWDFMLGAVGFLDYSSWDTNAADDFDGDYSSLTGKPANIDEDSTDDLTTGTTWGGDLSGTGSSPQVVDDSHNHVISNIDSFTKSELEGRLSDVNDIAMADGDVYTGVHDFGGATSIEMPNGTTPTTNAPGQYAMDTNGDGTTITTGVFQAYDGIRNLYGVMVTNYPTSDNDVPAYDSLSHSVVWQPQSPSGTAPTDAQYVVLTNDGTLTDERVLTAGDGINISDGGAGGNVTISSNQQRTVTAIFDGQGSVPAADTVTYFRVPSACTIQKVTILADQTGSAVVDIWKDAFANYPPTNVDSITSASPPTLSSASKAEDSTLTGWTKSISAGDVLGFNLDSASTLNKVTVIIDCK